MSSTEFSDTQATRAEDVAQSGQDFAGGPGLVAVGHTGGPDDADAVVWTSLDGLTWSRVAHDEAVFGGADNQEMFDVTTGGPGLVAVGWDGTGRWEDPISDEAAVWTSVDGITWTRVLHDKEVYGPGAMLSVTSDGQGLVAVGIHGSDPPLWTSPDGVTWSRLIDYEGVFGGARLFESVTAGGPGFIVVGLDGVWVAETGD